MNEQPNKVRVALYVRVSTEEQAEHGYSIDAQLETLRAYCRQQGKLIVGEYVDRGLSGKEMTKRHELNRLLRDIEAGLVDEVVVWKINRLSRKTKDLLEIVDRLTKYNVYFRSYSENFETETPAGRLTFQMLGVIGEFERNTLVENVKMGLKQRARTGQWNGGSVLGYESVETGEAARRGKATVLRIVQEEAAVVRKIFEIYASGRGFRSIANQINHEGCRTKKGNPFSSDSVREIVTNPVYTGIIRYNRFEGWSEKRRRGKNPKPILAEGKHEPIISQDLWDKAQALFKEKSKVSPRVYSGVSLLTGLIKCPLCGAPMVASRTVNYLKDDTKVTRRYYSCGNFRSKGSSVCRANSVKADYAEIHVLARIKEVLSHPRVLRSIVATVNNKRAAGIRPKQRELESIGKKLAQLADKKQKIVEVFELEAIDSDMLTARLDELAADVDALHARRSELAYELSEDNQEPVPFETVQDLLARFDELVAVAPPEQRKTLLHQVVKEIRLKTDKTIDKIELAFDESTVAVLTSEAPSANDAEGALSFRWPWRIVLSI